MPKDVVAGAIVGERSCSTSTLLPGLASVDRGLGSESVSLLSSVGRVLEVSSSNEVKLPRIYSSIRALQRLDSL